MTSSKSRIAPHLSPPLVIFTAKMKGGVGASTLALAIADEFDLAGLRLNAFQIDDQTRLAKSLGREVISIRLGFAEARTDPNILIRAFNPLFAAIEQASRGGASVLVDFGPTETARFLDYCRLAELDDDLTAFGLPAVVFAPAVAEPEAVRAASRTLSAFENALPSVTRVFVSNERDGCFDGLHPASETARAFREELQPLLARVQQIRMPAIEAGSWRWFEAACLRFTSAVAMTTEEVMALTGLSRPEAKIIRADVAAWLAEMEQQLASTFSFLESER
jgi:hypothetical protein